MALDIGGFRQSFPERMHRSNTVKYWRTKVQLRSASLLKNEDFVVAVLFAVLVRHRIYVHGSLQSSENVCVFFL